MCVCVTFCVCMTKKKNNFSDPFASPLNLHAIFSHLEWGGMHHPMLFLFFISDVTRVFLFHFFFPFYCLILRGRVFLDFFRSSFSFEMRLQFVFFFGRRQSSCSISWTSSLYVYFFFLNLGDAKNWQQKERKKKWVHRTCGHSHVTSRIFSPSLNGTHTHTWKEKKKS